MNKKTLLYLFSTAIALLILLSAGVLRGDAQDPFGKKPTPLSAQELTPAPTPEDGREVAILTLVIESGLDGKIEEINLEHARILKGYSPNVLGINGEWTVELIGDEGAVQFGVLDPRQLEVENAQNAAQPYTYIFVTNIKWDLVVPLFDDDKNLGVKTINIYDLEGNKIFSAEVDREGWTK